MDRGSFDDTSATGPGTERRGSVLIHRFSEKVSFTWSVADLHRGDYKQSEYGRVILPFTVFRRLDEVLAPTGEAVRDAAAKYASSLESLHGRMLLKASGQAFYNTSKLDFAALLADPSHVAQNLVGYLNGVSPNARDIVENFRLEPQIERLDRVGFGDVGGPALEGASVDRHEEHGRFIDEVYRDPEILAFLKKKVLDDVYLWLTGDRGRR